MLEQKATFYFTMVVFFIMKIHCYGTVLERGHNNDPDPKNEFLGPNYLVRISTNSFRE